jgi:hypothetical protein
MLDPKEGNRRRHGDEAIVGLHQLPATLVHLPVMAVAQQDQVFEVGLAPFGPVLEVMRLGP